uniref:Phosphatidylglycerophosphatase and protein-tyrosine phosphatase 1 n=1 Tax=Globodera rostochiensis TaxID=31243 RepID=A0A914HJB5_GLORO
MDESDWIYFCIVVKMINFHIKGSSAHSGQFGDANRVSDKLDSNMYKKAIECASVTAEKSGPRAVGNECAEGTATVSSGTKCARRENAVHPANSGVFSHCARRPSEAGLELTALRASSFPSVPTMANSTVRCNARGPPANANRRLHNSTNNDAMSDNVSEEEQQQQMQEIFICADVWLGVFAFLSPLELGHLIALISDRFDVLVDEHFKTRKWSLGSLELRAIGGNGAQIGKNCCGEWLPIPQGPLPNKVIGFNEIWISYIDQTVLEFLQRIRRLFDASGTAVSIHTFGSASRSWEIIRQKIWPLVNDNICRLLDSQLDLLRQFSPTVLRNCANLRWIESMELFPEFPAEDNADASSRQAVAKWLLTRRGDGRPKMLSCGYWEGMEGLKGPFVNALEPANFIIRLSDSPSAVIEPFELKNNWTGERLTLRQKDEYRWLLVRCPFVREEAKWAAWEKEAFEWELFRQWNRIFLIFYDSDIGDGMVDAEAGPIVLVSTFFGWLFSFSIIIVLPIDVAITFYKKCLVEESHRSVVDDDTTTTVPSGGDYRMADNEYFERNESFMQCEQPKGFVEDKFLLTLWRIVYWSSQFLTWILLPMLQSYAKAGEFTVKGRLKYAFYSNVVYYGIYFATFMLLLIYAVSRGVSLDFENLKVLLIAASNTWGLFQLVVLLGYGLIEVPRLFWRLGIKGYRLKRTYFDIDKMSSEKNESDESIREVYTETKNALNLLKSASGPSREKVKQIAAKFPYEFVKHLNGSGADPKESSTALPISSCSQLDIGSVNNDAYLIKLHRKVINAAQNYRHCQAQWHSLIESAFYLEDVELAEQSGLLPAQWARLDVGNGGTNRRKTKSAAAALSLLVAALPGYAKARFHLFVTLRRPISQCLAVCFAAMTALILWSECTFFIVSPQLSLAARVLHSAARGYHYKFIQLCAVAMILYLCCCAYFTIFQLRIFRYYRLDSNQTTGENSLIFSAMLICRLTAPLCLNFLGMIHLDSHVTANRGFETQFTKLMGHLDIIPLIAKGIDIYLPIVIVILCLTTWFRLGARFLHNLGVDQFLEEDEMTHEMVQSGKSLVSLERSRVNRIFGRKERNEAWEATSKGMAGRGLANFGVASSNRRGEDVQPILEEVGDDSAASADGGWHSERMLAARLDTSSPNVELGRIGRLYGEGGAHSSEQQQINPHSRYVLRKCGPKRWSWYSRINDTLVLGAMPFLSMLPELKENEHVGGVVCCTEEFELEAAWGAVKPTDWAQSDIQFHHTPMRDFIGSTSLQNIEEAVQFIDKVTSKGQTCYVHCKAGRTRSATVAICYLMHKFDFSPEQALDAVSTKRPQVLLRDVHWQSISHFRKTLDERKEAREGEDTHSRIDPGTQTVGFMLRTVTVFLVDLFNVFTTFCRRRLLPTLSAIMCLNVKVREGLKKAIEADETRDDKSGVIVLYKNVLKLLQRALDIRLNSCPLNKHSEVLEQQNKLSDFVAQTQDRLVKLEGLERNRRICIEPKAVKAAPFSLASANGSSSSRGMPCTSTAAKTFATKHPIESKTSLLKNVEPKLGEEILGTIVETTDTRLDDIEGNAMAKLALEENVVLPALNPKLFTGLRAPCAGILLFGPPGNGKTMLAKAVANECHSTFFSISAATIMSKWVGDGERLVKALFQVARNAQPSIIFIDEVDSMLCQRFEQENGAARRVKTEFLVRLDGCSSGSSDDRVLVLAATNRPQELDEGILRRFPQRIFIDLPDKMARFQMIRRTFEQNSTKLQLSDGELEKIASKTDNYSYSDLKALCRAAALLPVQSARKENRDLRRCTVEKLRPVNFKDLESAVRSVRPSVNAESRRKFLSAMSSDAGDGLESALKRQETGGLQNPLDCLRCNSAIKAPVRLPCQHHFCRLCIADEKCCYVCGRPIGCSELVEDKVLNYVLESSREVTETCANCDQISQPMFFCDTCHQPLCSGCRDTTHKAKIFSTHHIVELEERGRLQSRPFCAQHNEPFILFCLDSKSLMCIECFNASSLERRGHFVNIDVAHKICCDKLEKNALNLRIFQDELREQIELRKRLTLELEKNGEHLSEEIDQKCEAITKRVNGLRRQLLDRVMEEKAEKQRQLSAQLNKLTTLGSPISVNLLSVSIFCSYASKMDVLHCYADLHKSIQQFLSSNGRQLIQRVKFDCNFNIDFAAEFVQSVCQPLGLSASTLEDNANAHDIFLNCDPTARSSSMRHSSLGCQTNFSKRERQILSDLPDVEDPTPSKTDSGKASSAEVLSDNVHQSHRLADSMDNGAIPKLSDGDLPFEFNPFSTSTTTENMDININNNPLMDQRFSEQFQMIAVPLNGFAHEISEISKTLLHLQRDLTLRRCVVSPEDLLSKIASCEDAWKRLETHNKQVEGTVNHSLKQFWRREIERIQRQQLAVREKAREIVQLRSLAKRALKVSQQLKPFATQMASLISVIDVRRSSGSVQPSPMEQICLQITKMEPDSESRVAAIEKEETLRREAKLEEDRAQLNGMEALRAKKALREVRPPTPKMRTSHNIVAEMDRDRAGTDGPTSREGSSTLSSVASPSSSKKKQQHSHRRVHRSSDSTTAAEPLLNHAVSLISSVHEMEQLSPPNASSQMQEHKGRNGRHAQMGDDVKLEEDNKSSAAEKVGESSGGGTLTDVKTESAVTAAGEGHPPANMAITAQVVRGRDPKLLQAREKLLEAIKEKVKRIE